MQLLQPYQIILQMIMMIPPQTSPMPTFQLSCPHQIYQTRYNTRNVKHWIRHIKNYHLLQINNAPRTIPEHYQDKQKILQDITDNQKKYTIRVSQRT